MGGGQAFPLAGAAYLPERRALLVLAIFWRGGGMNPNPTGGHGVGSRVACSAGEARQHQSMAEGQRCSWGRGIG